MTLSRTLSNTPALVRPGFRLRVEHGLAIGKLQIFGADPEAKFRHVLGLDAPAAGKQIERLGCAFAWLSPSEWLLTGPEFEVVAWLAQIDARGGDDVLAVDLTHARAALLLDGKDARDVLASVCPLDLWSQAFAVHAVARSLLGDTGMFIARLADLTDGPRFRLIVDQTMEAYAVRLLAGPSSRSGTLS
jgi:sarcosine oxidase subunit gamma